MLRREELREDEYVCAQSDSRVGCFGPKTNLAYAMVEIPGGDTHQRASVERVAPVLARV
jgi:hypothetical protein